MAVQDASNNDNTPLVLSGSPLSTDDETIAQDATRTDPLVYGTIMAKVLATGFLTPHIDVLAEDGTALPYGIYVGEEITAAALVAGDVVDCPAIIGGNITVSRDAITLEAGALTDQIIAEANSPIRYTVEEALRLRGIFLEGVIDADEYENT